MKTLMQKRNEAEARQSAYKANPKNFGLRQKVKSGLLDPGQALGMFQNLPGKVVRWLNGTGRSRYSAALKG